MEVHALILEQCTGTLPMATIKVDMIAELAGKKLADPAFQKPAPVDMILGIELFNTLMLDERIRCGRIVLSETRLGWMITGVAEIADAGMSAHVSPFFRPFSSSRVSGATDPNVPTRCVRQRHTSRSSIT